MKAIGRIGAGQPIIWPAPLVPGQQEHEGHEGGHLARTLELPDTFIQVAGIPAARP